MLYLFCGGLLTIDVTTRGGTPMAVFQVDAEEAHRLTIRPNCALSWRWTKYLILIFAGCFALVGWYFTSLGAWLVLPFAGLELLVLAGGFYLSALAGHRREVIEIRENDLRVFHGGRRLREVARLTRHFSRVVLLRDPRGWHPSRLFLRCHGRSVELRTRLVEAEREELADLLRRRLGAQALVCMQAIPAALPAAGRAPVHHTRTTHDDRGLCKSEVRVMTGFPLPREAGDEVSRCATGAFSDK